MVVLGLGLLAFAVAAYQNLLTRRQRVRDFELSFIERYWTLCDRIRSPRSGRAGYSKLVVDERPDIELYLELCEDEVDMRRLGMISDYTWNVWREGIVSALEHEPYRTVWLEIREVTTGRYAHLRDIDQRREAGTVHSYDPCDLRLWTRWLRGLAGKG